MKKSFELVFTKESQKRLKRLNRQTQIRILKERRLLEEKPFASKQLVSRLSGLKSFRLGDYRIIYQMSEHKIIVLTVGHRKKTYDK